jgi:hypothetical protein
MVERVGFELAVPLVGERYEAGAERAAGALLVVLAVSFTIERLL